MVDGLARQMAPVSRDVFDRTEADAVIRLNPDHVWFLLPLLWNFTCHNKA
jgi:hypothetical protein